MRSYVANRDGRRAGEWRPSHCSVYDPNFTDRNLPDMRFERHHSAWIVASLITVASFIGATAYTQNRLARLDALSSTIETNAVPSIEYLSRTAVQLTRLNQLMTEVASPGPRRSAALPSVRKEVEALSRDVDQYLRLPTLPGEQTFWAELRGNVNRAVQLVDLSVSDAGEHPHAAQPRDADQVDDALDAAVRSVLTTLAFDVRQSEIMARDVRAVRSTTLRTIVALDALSTLIALVAVVFAFRATRHHDQLRDERDVLLATRVTELDRFAGRVAHDVLSPLSVVATGLSLVGRSADERSRTYIDRSQRALQRVQRLVEGLLAFARAGAHSGSGSNCSMDDILASLVPDCTDAAVEKGIEFVVENTQPTRVPCAPGVITSIEQNLLRNAIKYMGPRPVKRIAVRAFTRGAVARLEVEDTGPGIPLEIQTTLFEPFVRGPHEDASGAGLGLATVKRLVESHGGRIGVDSKLGVGSLFWVELPLLPAEVAETSSSVAAPLGF